MVELGAFLIYDDHHHPMVVGEVIVGGCLRTIVSIMLSNATRKVALVRRGCGRLKSRSGYHQAYKESQMPFHCQTNCAGYLAG